MAINWEKEYGTQPVAKKSNINWEKEYNPKGYQENITSQRNQLISEGKPVAINKEKVEPTKAGNILRSLIKPVADVATSAINTAQVALGKKETKPFSGAYLGKVEGLGKVDVFKSPLAPENVKTIKKSVGTGAELASYLAYGGIGTKVAKGAVSKLTETAAKDTFKEYVKKALPSLLKEGALTGVAQTGGSQLSENADTGKEFSWKQALTDVALSTALTPLAALGIQRALGTSSKKILDARAGVPKPEIEANIRAFGQSTRPNVPPAGVPPISKEVTLPKIDQATGLPVEAPKINTTPSKPIETTPVKNTIQEPTQTPQITPEVVSKDIETITKDIPNNENYSSGTFKEWSESLRSIPREELESVALGGEKTIQNNIPKDAYLSIMKNIADETGDIQLATRLAESNISSQSGQRLVANKLTSADNIVDDLRDIRLARMKKQGISEEAFKKESSALIDNIKSKFKVITDDVINSLICK